MKIKEMINLIETKGDGVSFYLTFKKANKLVAAIIKHFDDVTIKGCTLEPPEWDGYLGCYLVDFSKDDGSLYVQKGEFDNGRIARTDISNVVIQKKILGDRNPSQFTISGNDNGVLLV